MSFPPEILKKVLISKEDLHRYKDDLQHLFSKFDDYYIESDLDHAMYNGTRKSNIDFFKAFTRVLAIEELFLEICYVEEKPVAYLLGYIEDTSIYFDIKSMAYCDGIFVDEAYRGQRLGKELMNDFTNWCKDKNTTIMRLSVKLKNTDAITFYKNLGFEVDEYKMIKNI